jgi:hypothetical protein
LALAVKGGTGDFAAGEACVLLTRGASSDTFLAFAPGASRAVVFNALAGSSFLGDDRACGAELTMLVFGAKKLDIARMPCGASCESRLGGAIASVDTRDRSHAKASCVRDTLGGRASVFENSHDVRTAVFFSV